MRRIAWSVALALACLAAAGGGLQGPAGGAGSTGASPPAPACGTPPTSITLSPMVPCDVNATSGTLQGLQNDFDVYSWNSFIALNWPVSASGAVEPGVKIGQNGDNPTVWETWSESSDIFLAGGAPPPPFGQHTPPPAACQNLYTPGMRVVTQIGKTLLEEDVQPFKTGPLVDQNGQYTRFEITVNENMFDTIVGYQLYNQQGQQAYASAGNSVQFLCGSNPTSQVGAIMAKAAWKVLGKGDNPGRFHKVQALVYTPDAKDLKDRCVLQTLGMVGLHIAHKTTSAPQWIWSSFEQVDNAPDQGQVEPAGSHFNYYNAGCKGCPVNEPPPRPWNASIPGQPATQVERVIPIAPSTAQLNQTAAALLRSVNPASVWQYYELISTQWPTQPAAASTFCPPPGGPPVKKSPALLNETDGNPAPQFLANATLETYIQGSVPNVSSSCIRCHHAATATTGDTADFTYLLERAESVIAPPPAPSTSGGMQ
ncbi:MAG TPA: hypothetical protein VE685_05980 [Thermoanaerobaculia bacterium]|nr:hypothetical protein [Thermoanaerobaculia bacterium]